MAQAEEFPISELVRRTGAPRTTIHHYVHRGVLPKPRKVAGNRFLYGPKHVEGLKLIKLLRARRQLPLDVIAGVLPQLLNLDREEAFRPEMWDATVGLHLREVSKSAPERRLLKVATESFSRHGYAAVNIDDLCAGAGVAKGSLYRHFPSKEELFFAAAENAAIEVGEAFALLMEKRSPGTTEDVTEALAEALEPRLPLLLELWSRALQRRPGHPVVAGKVFLSLRREIARHLDPETGGAPEAVVPQAVFSVWSRMLASASPPGDLTGKPSA